jgi:osmotically-inducible protein OsmY
MERSSDEVRSWFGDEEAARRRRMDELRDERHDRDWGDRAARSGERGWERARDTLRDVTDRDRDGRRGMAEWNDSDRGSGSPRDPRPAYGEGAAWVNSSNRLDGGRNDYRTHERNFSDTSRYAPRDPDTAVAPPSAYTNWSNPSSSGRRDWQGPNYSGHGPRGYQRRDERILEDVCDRLTEDPRVDAGDIEVQVQNGEVTLTGGVRTREEKRFTEDLVERITGVREVNNNLKVRRADEVLGTARSGASSVLGLTDTPPPSTAPKAK